MFQQGNGCAYLCITGKPRLWGHFCLDEFVLLGEILFELPPEAFDPPPKVHSAVIRLIKRAEVVPGADDAGVLKLVKMAFQQRRKN